MHCHVGPLKHENVAEPLARGPYGTVAPWPPGGAMAPLVLSLAAPLITDQCNQQPATERGTQLRDAGAGRADEPLALRANFSQLAAHQKLVVIVTCCLGMVEWQVYRMLGLLSGSIFF